MTKTDEVETKTEITVVVGGARYSADLALVTTERGATARIEIPFARRELKAAERAVNLLKGQELVAKPQARVLFTTYAAGEFREWYDLREWLNGAEGAETPMERLAILRALTLCVRRTGESPKTWGGVEYWVKNPIFFEKAFLALERALMGEGGDLAAAVREARGE